jgi:TnpA family transposase
LSRLSFTHLLGFRLLPRLKNIGGSRLYPPDADTAVYTRRWRRC